MWQFSAPNSCQLVYHINVAKSSNDLHTLRTAAGSDKRQWPSSSACCVILSLLTLHTSDQQAQNNQNFVSSPRLHLLPYKQQYITTACLSTRSVSTPKLTHPAQSVNQPSTPNPKLPICFGTSTPIPIFMLNNTSYFQQHGDRIRNKGGRGGGAGQNCTPSGFVFCTAHQVLSRRLNYGGLGVKT